MSRRYPPLITQAGQQLAAATADLAPPQRPTSRMLQTVDGAVRGRTVEFEVDTAFLESEAKLKFHVTGPSRTEVHAIPRPAEKTHLVTFVPQDAGIFSLRVTYNEVEVDGSPFHISVADDPKYVPPAGDASKCVASGPGLSSCVENQTACFEVDTSRAGFGRLTVKMTGPSKAEIVSHPPPIDASSIEDVGKGPSKFDYKPLEAGEYNLYICWSERHIPGSPFKVNVRRNPACQVEDKVEQCLEAAKKVLVPPCDGLRNGTSRQWRSFLVDARAAGDGAVAVSVQGPTRCDIELVKQNGGGSSNNNNSLANTSGLGAVATDRMSGLIEVRYRPDSTGKFVMQVTFNDIQAPESPFTINVTD
eukprot:scpid42337/ scgid34375/ Filamin-B; ABP-278; ABP-280 homolog; Actin-binding-like protein; Beta-filamin; Filamin homolog 1; Filamin-3; Thyroid autoantigen; Truncated actin-binding protein